MKAALIFDDYMTEMAFEQTPRLGHFVAVRKDDEWLFAVIVSIVWLPLQHGMEGPSCAIHLRRATKEEIAAGRLPADIDMMREMAQSAGLV